MSRLEIRDVSKSYGRVRALRNVSLSIPRGVFGLLGPNGAGKSTLMRTVATLQRPDTGSVTLDGVDAVADPEHVRRRLGYLPQEFGVYPNVSAERLLDHLAVLKGVEPRGERRRQVSRLLERTNLHAHRKRAVSEFSGGMRRRFGIAQALLGEPEVVVVDEPTAGLDPAERRRFQDLLSRIGERVIVLLSTHIVADVRTLCSRMAILGGGSVLLEGEPDRLLERLDGRIWRASVGRDEIEEYRAEMEVVSHRLFAGRIQLRVWAERRPAGEFEPVDGDLEDLYFRTLDRSEADPPDIP